MARYAALAAERPQLPHSRRDSEEAVIQRLRTAFTVWPVPEDKIFTVTLKYEIASWIQCHSPLHLCNICTA